MAINDTYGLIIYSSSYGGFIDITDLIAISNPTQVVSGTPVVNNIMGDNLGGSVFILPTVSAYSNNGIYKATIKKGSGTSYSYIPKGNMTVLEVHF